jgi:hypothetical protein
MPLHLEFTVEGPPVSHQTKDKASLRAWKARVRGAAAQSWTGPPVAGRLKFTLINFHEGAVAPLDDDNMVKPVRDALNQFVYNDDRQITHSETVQIGIDEPVKVRRASRILLAAYGRGEPFLYVRVETSPDFIQLPQ